MARDGRSPILRPASRGAVCLYTSRVVFSVMASNHPSGHTLPNGKVRGSVLSCALKKTMGMALPRSRWPSPPRWLVRTGGIWGNHLARRVKPQHLKIASCKRAHPAASLTRSLYIYRSILNSSHGRRCCAVQAIDATPSWTTITEKPRIV